VLKLQDGGHSWPCKAGWCSFSLWRLLWVLCTPQPCTWARRPLPPHLGFCSSCLSTATLTPTCSSNALHWAQSYLSLSGPRDSPSYRGSRTHPERKLVLLTAPSQSQVRAGLSRQMKMAHSHQVQHQSPFQLGKLRQGTDSQQLRLFNMEPPSLTTPPGSNSPSACCSGCAREPVWPQPGPAPAP
jgi:hypothetical protein